VKVRFPASRLADPVLSGPLTGGDRLVPRTLDAKGSKAIVGQVDKAVGGRKPSPKSAALKEPAASPPQIGLF
jgi:hypothetical protein